MVDHDQAFFSFFGSPENRMKLYAANNKEKEIEKIV